MRKVISKFAVAALLLAPAIAHAQIVGTNSGGNCIPFACRPTGPGTVYQQVYAASNFSAPGLLNSFSFFRVDGTTLPALSFDVYVSTTTAAVNALSTSDFDANRGANNTLFGSYTLGGAVGATLTFTGTPFLYDPSQGNLLLDFRFTSTSPSSGTTYFAANNGNANGVYSRAQNFGSENTNWGLQTQFNFSAPTTTVPEPASVALMASGLLAVGALARRRRRV